ncbi:hypothetical protein PVAND_005750 [Polypedilum vanderplanki]|uniref:Uncharacterized protein n=1 Tax=Polypedilum vanderplanki TaxID=319348 RepID=A0A9J6C1Z2_POLVA|nr:hypothetical protein PVAND_005750 [Polypedilum vanderplanki]
MKFMIVLLVIFLTLMINIVYCGSVTKVIHSVTGVEGEWKQKWTWKSKWVKSWTPKTIYVAKWTKVWTPAVIKEYVPHSPLPQNNDHLHHVHIKSTSVQY